MSGLLVVYMANVLVAGWIDVVSPFALMTSSRTIFQELYQCGDVIRLVECFWSAIAILCTLGVLRPESFALIPSLCAFVEMPASFVLSEDEEFVKSYKYDSGLRSGTYAINLVVVDIGQNIYGVTYKDTPHELEQRAVGLVKAMLEPAKREFAPLGGTVTQISKGALSIGQTSAYSALYAKYKVEFEDSRQLVTESFYVVHETGVLIIQFLHAGESVDRESEQIRSTVLNSFRFEVQSYCERKLLIIEGIGSCRLPPELEVQGGLYRQFTETEIARENLADRLGENLTNAWYFERANRALTLQQAGLNDFRSQTTDTYVRVLIDKHTTPEGLDSDLLPELQSQGLLSAIVDPLRVGLVEQHAEFDAQILKWYDPGVVLVGGKNALKLPFLRTGERGPVYVESYYVYDTDHSYSIICSYRQEHEHRWERPIEQLIGSIEFK